MRCTHTIDKNTVGWSKTVIQEVGQGHEDRVCNTNDLQTLIYFTGSYAQLPSKSPVLPLEVIVPGWLGDRCQVAPPQLIHHAKQKGKADLGLSLALSLFFLFLCTFLFLCLFLVTSSNYIVITSECPDHMLAMIYDKVWNVVCNRRSGNNLICTVKSVCYIMCLLKLINGVHLWESGK